MRTVFSDHAWEDYLHWQTDKQTLKKIHALIKDIQRTPYDGIGKPEPLRHSLSGLWSRRIDDKNRLIYRCKDGDLELVAVGFHYGDH